MAAGPGSRVVGHEAERFGSCGADHLVDVDAHAVGDHLHLVHQADVHRPVDVLQQLRHLGDSRGANQDDLGDSLAVERNTQSTHQRQADVAQPDDADGGVTRLE
jgi:hypothetical protein